MSMTKKDFIALADMIITHNKVFGGYGESFDSRHLDTLADFCAASNPRFNRERWVAYIAGKCGPNGGMKKEAK